MTSANSTQVKTWYLRRAGGTTPENEDPEALKMAVVARMLEMDRKRAKMFDMSLPVLSQLATEAGVELNIPREDEPCDDGKPK